jgi:hypothetical protein
LTKSITAALMGICVLSGCAHPYQKNEGATPLTTDIQTPRTATLTFEAFGGRQETASFAFREEAGGARSYVQASSMPTRDAAPSTITYGEAAGMPSVRTGSVAFDALFAHAVVEMKENSVAAIRDGAYNDGKPIPCECFETGEKWNYVWTRDLSYAANLGLAMLDPQRVRNSLEFKLSRYRPGIARAGEVAGSDDGLQIIQDTGSGGSWPVSTDRVSWAFGAEEALNALPPAERAAFAVTALKALANTIENDRLAAFDPRDGLYTGEQSFLDWREQSYGSGIADDLARMASSKALSTNIAHFKALSLAAQLAAEQGQGASGDKYRGWAGQLKAAINARFWLDDASLYSSLTAAHFDGAALHKYDWLGQSLAIVTGVADEERSARILASYPHGPVGAPVIFPQQQGVPIYHNRSIWPFVTAYGLNAAVVGRNVSVADAAFSSLVRGASLHLSNMENMEWLSGAPMLQDPQRPALSGPVINSRRQLWSVGAYLGMVIRTIFGVSPGQDGVRVQPFITSKLRREMFGASNRISLDGLRFRDKAIRLHIALPPASPADGYFSVEAITLNGRAAGASIGWDQLAEDNEIEVRLGALRVGRQEIRRVADDPLAADGAMFAPFEAQVERVVRDARGQLVVHIADAQNPPGSVSYQLYRNGKLVADRLPLGAWTDKAPAVAANCYAVGVVANGSGNRSHHSAARCLEAGIEIGADDARISSNLAIAQGGVAHFKDWGAPHDRLEVRDFVVATDGRYSIQVRYKNTGHAINTGISNGVKVLSVRDVAGQVVARQVIQMPHLPVDSTPMYSTPAEMVLAAGSYSIALSDFYNMSYLDSNRVYGAGGGKSGPLNRVDIYGLKILTRE